MTVKQFNTWEEAFDYCRERNCPVIIKVDGETAKIFPSGAAKTLDYKT